MTLIRQQFRSAKRRAGSLICKLRLGAKGISVGENLILGGQTQFEVWSGGRCNIGSDVFIGRGVGIRVWDTGSLTIEDGVMINCYAQLECRGDVFIGRNSLLNIGANIVCSGAITIGQDVLLAPYVFLADVDHKYDRLDLPISRQGETDPRPIQIGDGAWLGTKVTVTKGVMIGEGVVIGANAVVTKSIPPFSVAVGMPAKVIRYRTNAQEVGTVARETDAT